MQTWNRTGGLVVVWLTSPQIGDVTTS